MKRLLKIAYYVLFLLCALWIPLYSELSGNYTPELISLFDKIIVVGLIILVLLNVLDFTKTVNLEFKKVKFFKTELKLVLVSNVDRLLILVFVPLSDYWQSDGVNVYFILLFLFMLTSIRIFIKPNTSNISS